MDETKGLAEYVAWKPYRDSMGLLGKKAEEYKLLAQGEYNRNYLVRNGMDPVSASGP